MLFSDRKRQRLIDHQGSLLAYATALCGDRQLAADLVQDCAVRVLRTTRAPGNESTYKAWLFTILRNLWLDHLRTRKLRREVPVEEAEHQPALPVAIESVLVNALAVRQAFALLSADHRDVLTLVDIGGFSYEETARLLQISKGTVMSRVSRARTALAALLEADNVTELPVRKGLRSP